MKKSNLTKRGPQDANQLPSQPDKLGWIRKFCGRGIFREIWKTRFVVLRGDHLYISEKEKTFRSGRVPCQQPTPDASARTHRIVTQRDPVGVQWLTWSCGRSRLL
ncbi:hypothetical protein DPEC_G00202230 [Dallia pectoralis]|uniref:Uncharacterized protein n=1 Tax=Dallia pectoralis TaxID=75939 RepID=A0ACC2G9H9_DALPE|nr:hypothetical protein DPEC_G00202230 [Dallia pectoralis]